MPHCSTRRIYINAEDEGSERSALGDRQYIGTDQGGMVS